MSSFTKSLLSSFVGALQASLSILLTLGYGVFANRIGLYGKTTSDDISKLCAKLFLPALIFTNVGKELSLSKWREYVLVLVWALLYCFLSYLLGLALKKAFRLPKWVVPAICFNNTTSLPLLLTQALSSTGVLEGILPKGMELDEAIDRAKSYYLVNSMISNTLTFAFGPRLLSQPGDSEDDDDDDNNGEENEEENEQSPLLPSHIRDPVIRAKDRVQQYTDGLHARLPKPLQQVTSLLMDTANPTLLGSFMALFVGFIPPLHRIFFNDSFEGGYFKAWLTASIKNIGELFTVLQMFVAGYQLSSSFDAKGADIEFPKLAFAIVFFVRIILWPAISVPLIYYFAMAAKFLPPSASPNEADPYSILWFAMMLMPIGPPAIAVTCVFGLVASGPEGRKENMRIARVLAVMYAVTPLISFAVVAALKVTEAIGTHRTR